jgi:Zn2+/Cd2+-exporting ATPase
VLAPLGLVTLVMAVAADMGMSLLVTLNGLRLLRERRGVAAPVSAPAAACTDDCCSHG